MMMLLSLFLPVYFLLGFNEMWTDLSLFVQVILCMVLFRHITNKMRTPNLHQQTLLCVLIAMAVLIRMFTLPLGASTAFILPMYVGAFFGSGFGMLLAFVSSILSNVVVGGLGPWTPYQIILLTLLAFVSSSLGHRWMLIKLLVLGFVYSFVYGFFSNLWFWPSMHVQRIENTNELFGQYLKFYVSTSLLWDAIRAVFNVMFVLMLHQSIMKMFNRFKNISTIHEHMPTGLMN